MRSPATLAAVAALLAAGCASLPDPALREGIVDARRERVCTFEEMVEDLATVRMVFVGETHTNPAHHEVQRRVLEALSHRRRHLIVGLEMVQRPYQETLDAWSAGEMDEETFLREGNWFGQWGFEWELYAPILRLARDRRIRAVGLNVDRSFIAEVRRKGLEGVSPWVRSRLPDEIDLSVKAHRKSMREVFSSSAGHPGAEDGAEDRFRMLYEAQVTWDETMAESAVRALAAAPPDAAIVVLAGLYHVKDFHAIPERARRRNGLDYRVVLPLDEDQVPPEGVRLGMGRAADYVVFTPPTPPSQAVWFGVALRGGDTLVTSVAGGSAAAAAGLREGDFLVAVDDRKVSDPVDIRLALEARVPGDRVRVRWRRDGAAMEGEAALPLRPDPFAPRPPAPK